MKPADRDDVSAACARIVPLRPPVAGSLADLLTAAVAAVVPGERSRIRVTCDVDPQLDVPGSALLLLEAIAPLVDAAVAATDQPRGPSDFPVLDEVVVTAVDMGHSIEIEIADSAGDSSAAWGSEPLPEATVTAVARLGGSLEVRPCSDGGRAVTIRFPRRRVRSLAA